MLPHLGSICVSLIDMPARASCTFAKNNRKTIVTGAPGAALDLPIKSITIFKSVYVLVLRNSSSDKYLFYGRKIFCRYTYICDVYFKNLGFCMPFHIILLLLTSHCSSKVFIHRQLDYVFKALTVMFKYFSSSDTRLNKQVKVIGG